MTQQKPSLGKLRDIVLARQQGTGRSNRLQGTYCEDEQDHRWLPVQLLLETGGFQPDLNQGKCFVVCMVCHSWSYILTEFVGYYVPDPDTARLEAAE